MPLLMGVREQGRCLGCRFIPLRTKVRTMSMGSWLGIRQWESALKSLEVRHHGGQGAVVTL